jgi:2-hydroxy-3-oxopropionate reductase
MAERIGFVGLGIMGKPMARNLLKAGYSLTIFDIVTETMADLIAEGAKEATSSKEVAADARRIITMLPDSKDSEEAILGFDGVLEGTHANSVVIDMSSIAPMVSQRIATRCAEQDVEMLDAPVSGGESRAVDGTLAIMVGGKQEVFDSCFELLQSMGSNVVLTGDIGAGGITKLANQIIVAANLQALSEALVLAQKAGVAPEKVFNAIRSGLAGSAVMEAKGPMMLDRDFRPGFRMRLHQKDLRNVLHTAQELKVPLPITSVVQQILEELVIDGEGEADHSAILHFLERMAGVEISRSG